MNNCNLAELFEKKKG